MAWSREGKEGGGGFKLLACTLNPVPVVVCGGWVGGGGRVSACCMKGLVSSLARKEGEANSWGAGTLPAVRHHDHHRHPVHPAPQPVCVQCVRVVCVVRAPSNGQDKTIMKQQHLHCRACILLPSRVFWNARVVGWGKERSPPATCTAHAFSLG